MSHTVLPRTGPAPAPRGRIGAGFSPVPHRYHLYLSAGCPRSLRAARRPRPAGPRRTPSPPPVLGTDTEAAEYTALRLAYEAAGHHFDGALTVPALSTPGAAASSPTHPRHPRRPASPRRAPGLPRGSPAGPADSRASQATGSAGPAQRIAAPAVEHATNRSRGAQRLAPCPGRARRTVPSI